MAEILLLSDLKQNLALMKIARHEVNKGNKVYTKHNSPDKIYCSWAFENSLNGQSRLDEFKDIEIIEGGYFVDPSIILPDNIEHSMPYYPLYENGSTIPRMGYTSRGCNNKCPWCIVWRKEGRLKDHAPINEFWDGKEQRLFILDNDFINSPRFRENIDYIIENDIKVNVHQGMNIRGITDTQAELITSIGNYTSSFKSRGTFFAWDRTKDEAKVLRGIEKLREFWPISYFNFYVIAGFPNGDEFDDIYYRCKVLTEQGIRPYVMPYEKANKKIRQLKRCVSLGTWRKRGLDRAWAEYVP
jgi:hypothetical protein